MRTRSRGKAHEEALDAIAGGHMRPRRVIEKDQVDIARIIELATAELAHAEHDEPAVLLQPIGICRLDRAGAHRLAQQVPQGGADCSLGETAQRQGLLFQRPAAGKFGDRGEKGRAPPRNSEPPHQRRRIFAKISRLLDACGEAVEDGIGTGLDEAGQEGPFLYRGIRKERAVAEDCFEQTTAGKSGAPAAGGVRLWLVGGAG